MPMLLVDDESFDLELSKLNGVRARVETRMMHGRNPGDTNIPSALRQVIAEEATNGASVEELTKAFGVSASSVSAYKNGATSTTSYHQKNEKLESVIDRTRDKIHRRASSKLLKALTEITDEKLKDARATDLSSIAANMSRVIEKTSPKEDSKIQNNIIFVSPTQIHADNYEVIDV
jgi:predicted transcriptional regulator